MILSGTRFRPGGGVGDELDRRFILIGIALLAGFMLICGFYFNSMAIDVWTAILVFMFLMFGSVPIFRYIARAEASPWLFKLLFLGLLAKLGMSMARYYVIFTTYKGQGDAGLYLETGIEFARRWREGIPIYPLDRMSHYPIEARRVADFTGYLCILLGASRYAVFFVFSAICYTGQVLMVRAFMMAVPEADSRRYAMLVLFLPSVMFWPSSVGKESLMLGLIGLISYGAGLLLAPKPRLSGIVFFAAGLALSILIRPHIALMGIGGLGAALVIGAIGSRGGMTSGERAIRIVGLVVVVGLAGGASTAAAGLFQQQAGSEGKLDASTTSNALSSVAKQTSIGGSAFTPVQASNPLLVPLAVVSVLIRPFPWEAKSVNSLVAASEGLLLALLIVLGRKRIRSIFRLGFRRPFIVFSGVFTIVFVVAFSFVGNFGILARQRTIMIPSVLVFLAGTQPTPLRKKWQERLSGGTDGSDDSGSSDTVLTVAAPSRRTTAGATPKGARPPRRESGAGTLFANDPIASKEQSDRATRG